jgi:twitching motility protein PilJ
MEAGLQLAKGIAAITQGVNRIVELAQQFGQSGVGAREAELANQLATLAQRIAKNAAALAASAEVDPELATMLSKDAGTFRDVQGAISRAADPMRMAAGRNDAPLAELAKRASVRRRRRSGRAEHGAARIGEAGGEERQQRRRGASRGYDEARRHVRGRRQDAVPLWFAIIFALLALGTLLLLGKVFLDDARVRAFESEDENKRTRKRSWRLLNEMGNLADGDLTVQALTAT